MLAKKTVIRLIKDAEFINKKEEKVKYKQLCLEDSERLYVVSASANLANKVGDEIVIAYDGKRYSILEYTS